MRARQGFVVLATVSALASAPQAHACTGTHTKLKADNAAKVAKATVCLINRHRAKAGLKRMKADRKLRAAAATHSQDMVAQGYFEHDGPSGDTVVTRAQNAGYLKQSQRSWALAENIAYGAGGLGTAAAIVRSWMRSEGHRANILTKSFRDIGVGLAPGTPDGGSGATFTLDVGFAR